jgi:hypothetical protein
VTSTQLASCSEALFKARIAALEAAVAEKAASEARLKAEIAQLRGTEKSTAPAARAAGTSIDSHVGHAASIPASESLGRALAAMQDVKYAAVGHDATLEQQLEHLCNDVLCSDAQRSAVQPPQQTHLAEQARQRSRANTPAAAAAWHSGASDGIVPQLPKVAPPTAPAALEPLSSHATEPQRAATAGQVCMQQSAARPAQPPQLQPQPPLPPPPSPLQSRSASARSQEQAQPCMQQADTQQRSAADSVQQLQLGGQQQPTLQNMPSTELSQEPAVHEQQHPAPYALTELQVLPPRPPAQQDAQPDQAASVQKCHAAGAQPLVAAATQQCLHANEQPAPDVELGCAADVEHNDPVGTAAARAAQDSARQGSASEAAGSRAAAELQRDGAGGAGACAEPCAPAVHADAAAAGAPVGLICAAPATPRRPRTCDSSEDEANLDSLADLKSTAAVQGCETAAAGGATTPVPVATGPPNLKLVAPHTRNACASAAAGHANEMQADEKSHSGVLILRLSLNAMNQLASPGNSKCTVSRRIALVQPGA